MKLKMLVGPCGSGKSTLARELVKEGYTYINQDSQGRDHLRLFIEAVAAKQPVLVDRMNFTKEQRKRYLDAAKAAGYTTSITVLHQPYEVCLARCLARTGHETIKDPRAAHGALDMFFTKYERVTDDEADEVFRWWPDGLKPLAVIVDIDGTIADLEHRRHFVRKAPGEKKDWAGFFGAMKDDKAFGWCTDLVNTLSKKYSIVFCSGRPDNYRKVTADWLDNFVHYENLFMRHRQDQRQDNVVKEIILDFEILTRYTPHFMLDDRDQVVKMWRDRGYTCLQCAPGDF
jgi:predicted kinase